MCFRACGKEVRRGDTARPPHEEQHNHHRMFMEQSPCARAKIAKEESEKMQKCLEQPGIEPGPATWKEAMLPLYHCSVQFSHQKLSCKRVEYLHHKQKSRIDKHYETPTKGGRSGRENAARPHPPRGWSGGRVSCARSWLPAPRRHAAPPTRPRRPLLLLPAACCGGASRCPPASPDAALAARARTRRAGASSADMPARKARCFAIRSTRADLPQSPSLRGRRGGLPPP